VLFSCLSVVEFASVAEAQNAVNKLQQSELSGRNLFIREVGLWSPFLHRIYSE
jgi:hypothetical protein